MIDRNKVEQAVRLLLEGMGEDPSREGLIDTPERVARMYEELYSGMDEHPGMYLEKTFRAENNDLIVEKDITFILSVNIIFFLFTEKCMSPMCRIRRWRD